MTREKLQEVVNDPRDVIYFLSETPNVLGEGKSVTGYYCPPLKKNPHGICVQLRQFFGGGTAETYTSLHYEIEEYRKGIVVEIHSEMVEAFPSIHAFVYDQFKEGHELRFKGRERKGKLTIKKAYRFATKTINWRGRKLGEILEDIKKAVAELYKEYDGYLNYLEKNYLERGMLDGCKSFEDFKRTDNS